MCLDYINVLENRAGGAQPKYSRYTKIGKLALAFLGFDFCSFFFAFLSFFLAYDFEV